jgi:hypothetical protein
MISETHFRQQVDQFVKVLAKELLPGPCPPAPPFLPVVGLITRFERFLKGEASAYDGGACGRDHLAVDIEDSEARIWLGEGVSVLSKCNPIVCDIKAAGERAILVKAEDDEEGAKAPFPSPLPDALPRTDKGAPPGDRGRGDQH